MALASAGLGLVNAPLRGHKSNGKHLRLGGPAFGSFHEPGDWARWHRENGYRAAQCPLKPGAPGEEIRAYREAALEQDVVIAEVGAWSNPISPHEEEAEKALEKCIRSLQLADELGARCCVNISGSKNPEHWAGPHEDNMSEAVFEQVVESTRTIIDAVNPRRTYFTLEAMPWSYPWSTESYVRLLEAMDRKAFAVHLDPVNMITSPQDFYNNGALIREAFRVLGPHIRSCHGKDIILREDNYIPQLDELRPGLGKLDYRVFLKELAALDDVPLMMEHLKTHEEYQEAANYIRSVGQAVGIRV